MATEVADAAERNGRAASSRSGRGGASFDELMTDAALGTQRRWLPGVAGVKAVAKLATKPDRVARRTGGLAAELAKVAAGRSEVAPPKGDRRFKDPAWATNPIFKRLGQTYLATVDTVDGLLCDADLGWADERRVRFAAENVVSALAPSNAPLTNPTVLKAVIDTGGANLVKGFGQFVRDMSSRPRIPTMVDPDAFTVGEDLAITPGSVVLRTDVFELIQYRPQTARVRELPLVIVPPMINKFYVTDIAPNRSMVEHFVRHGQQVFTISWRNPGAEQADWSLETYVGAVLEAFDAVQEISGAGAVHTLGLCAGGITLSCAVAHLAAREELDRIAGLTLGVTVIDNEQSGTVGAFVGREVAALAVAESARRGYLDGRQLAGVFAWLRPNDLIWNYWVNNYLLGKSPPAFDVLYWNADTTNLPAGLHRDFLQVGLENPLVRPGGLTVLGTPVDLSKITVDSYLVAGIADHITPWENCYRTTQLLGSSPRFVLSTSGHIAALVNPPGNEKASFQTRDDNPPAPDAWLDGASKHRGTWWDDWLAWLGERSGDEVEAPSSLGSDAHQPLEDAPGTYVFG
jgi:polyhydroxyalkanoate synthase subunit PhaC